MTDEETVLVQRAQAFEAMTQGQGWKFLTEDMRAMEQVALNKFAGSNAYDEAGVKAMIELRGRIKALRNIENHIYTILEHRDEILKRQKEGKKPDLVLEGVNNG